MTSSLTVKENRTHLQYRRQTYYTSLPKTAYPSTVQYLATKIASTVRLFYSKSLATSKSSERDEEQADEKQAGLNRE